MEKSLKSLLEGNERKKFTWIENDSNGNNNIPKLKRVDGNPEGRFYTIDGDDADDSEIPSRFFSVTTVLGDDPSKKKALHEWRKRVGNEEANRISRTASGRGTKIHDILEKYIRGDEINPDSILPHLIPLLKSGISGLDPIDAVYVLEQKLFSRKMGIAGTVDGIVKWNGVDSILDFKTSKRVKTKFQIEDYFLQTCAYGHMWNELTGSKIEQVVIYIMVDDEPNPFVFTDEIARWTPSLLKRIKEFYERRNLGLPTIFFPDEHLTEVCLSDRMSS